MSSEYLRASGLMSCAIMTLSLGGSREPSTIVGENGTSRRVSAKPNMFKATFGSAGGHTRERKRCVKRDGGGGRGGSIGGSAGRGDPSIGSAGRGGPSIGSAGRGGPSIGSAGRGGPLIVGGGSDQRPFCGGKSMSILFAKRVKSGGGLVRDGSRVLLGGGVRHGDMIGGGARGSCGGTPGRRTASPVESPPPGLDCEQDDPDDFDYHPKPASAKARTGVKRRKTKLAALDPQQLFQESGEGITKGPGVGKKGAVGKQSEATAELEPREVSRKKMGRPPGSKNRKIRRERNGVGAIREREKQMIGWAYAESIGVLEGPVTAPRCTSRKWKTRVTLEPTSASGQPRRMLRQPKEELAQMYLWTKKLVCMVNDRLQNDFVKLDTEEAQESLEQLARTICEKRSTLYRALDKGTGSVQLVQKSLEGLLADLRRLDDERVSNLTHVPGIWKACELFLKSPSELPGFYNFPEHRDGVAGEDDVLGEDFFGAQSSDNEDQVVDGSVATPAEIAVLAQVAGARNRLLGTTLSQAGPGSSSLQSHQMHTSSFAGVFGDPCVNTLVSAPNVQGVQQFSRGSMLQQNKSPFGGIVQPLLPSSFLTASASLALPAGVLPGWVPEASGAQIPATTSGSKDNLAETAGPISMDTAGPISEDTAGPISEDTAGPISEDTAGPISEDTAGPFSEDTAGPFSAGSEQCLACDPSLADQLPYFEQGCLSGSKPMVLAELLDEGEPVFAVELPLTYIPEAGVDEDYGRGGEASGGEQLSQGCGVYRDERASQSFGCSQDDQLGPIAGALDALFDSEVQGKATDAWSWNSTV